MRLHFPSWILIAAAVGVTACGSGSPKLQIGSIYEPGLTVTGENTFRILPDPTMDAAAAVSNSPMWQEKINAAITADLQAKGFILKPQGKTDLLVAHHLVLKEGEKVAVIDNYSGYKLPSRERLTGTAAAAKAAPTGTGTLIVDIIDPVKKQVAWRGWARTELDRTRSNERREALIKKAVSEILTGFPPKG